MGADNFQVRVRASGDTHMAAAFRSAVDDARYENGHRGYTGTIAEKTRAVIIELPHGITAGAYIEALWDGETPPEGVSRAKFGADCAAIEDKWGPAGAIRDGDDWVFFGWASS